MSDTPKCPYCGREMKLWDDGCGMLWYSCPKCLAEAPVAHSEEAAYTAAMKWERPKGKWVKVDDDLYRCSHCHSEIEMRDIYIAECRYCPICGAEMRSGGEIDENAKRI